jgi:hypothetical protein
MVSLGKTRQMDRSQAARYLRVARALHSTVSDLSQLSTEGDTYGNAMAIVAVHAGIAYADALSIAFREIKSVDGDHSMAVATLRHAIGHRADEEQIKRLGNIIDQKSAVSYQGQYYTLADARAVVEKLDAFAEWVLSRWEERP